MVDPKHETSSARLIQKPRAAAGRRKRRVVRRAGAAGSQQGTESDSEGELGQQLVQWQPGMQQAAGQAQHLEEFPDPAQQSRCTAGWPGPVFGQLGSVCSAARLRHQRRAR